MMDTLGAKRGFLCDMDGVVYRRTQLLPGVPEFVDWLNREGKQYLFLTNNSTRTPAALREKLAGMGLDVGEEHFFTSAQATADFLSVQAPGARVFVIGEDGLFQALEQAGFILDDTSPDFVIIGETTRYDYAKMSKAVTLVSRGALLIATNSDLRIPVEDGFLPACRTLVAPVELATGKGAYFIGKPNPLMVRSALQRLGIHGREAVMIGDNMETDIRAGVEYGLDTVLVLSGVATRESVAAYPYRPGLILNGVGDIPKMAR